MATCNARPWTHFSDKGEPLPPPAPVRPASRGGKRTAPTKAATPRFAVRVEAERTGRRRTALAAVEANQMRSEMDQAIQELLRSLPIVDVREAVRKGANLLLATANLDGLSQPTPVKLRVFAQGGEILVQIRVPRLRTGLLLPLSLGPEIPKALNAIVLARLD